MAAGWERLSSIKIRHPDASLNRVSRLVLPWNLGSGEELNFLPRPQITYLSPPKNFCSHPCHCSHPRASAEAEQEWPQRCACPPWAHLNELDAKIPWSNASLEPVGMSGGSIPVLGSCCSYRSAASSSQPEYLILMSLSTSWLNKTAPLLVVRNASGEERKKASLCIDQLDN